MNEQEQLMKELIQQLKLLNSQLMRIEQTSYLNSQVKIMEYDVALEKDNELSDMFDAYVRRKSGR